MFLPHAPPRCKVVCFLWPKKTPVALVAIATEHSAAAPRPRSAPALSHRRRGAAFVGQVSSKLCLCLCCCSSTCRRAIKKVQARISLRTTLCRPARFNTCVLINIRTHIRTYLQLSYVSSFILILGTPTLFTLWTGSEHHETLPHNLINSRPLVNNQIPNLTVPCGKKLIKLSRKVN